MSLQKLERSQLAYRVLLAEGTGSSNGAFPDEKSTGIEQLESVVRIVVTNYKEKEEEDTVNWEQTKGRWNQMKGTVKKQWGKLTDDDLALIAGQRDQLVGKIQERYGIAKEEADRQVKTWESMRVNEPEEVRSEEKRRAS